MTPNNTASSNSSAPSCRPNGVQSADDGMCTVNEELGAAPLIQSARIPISAARVTPEPLAATARCDDFPLGDPRHDPPPHYPGVRPATSYAVAEGTVFPIRPGDLPSGWEVLDSAGWTDLDVWLEARNSPVMRKRLAVLAYGSNANPKSVATIAADGPVVVLSGLLFGAQASYCASTRRDGQYPAGLVRSTADIAERHVLLLVDPARIGVLDRKEGAGLGIYRRIALSAGNTLEFVLEDGSQWSGPLPAYVQGPPRPIAMVANAPVPLRQVAQLAFQELIASGASVEDSPEHGLPLLSRYEPTPGLHLSPIPALVPQAMGRPTSACPMVLTDASARYRAPGVNVSGPLVWCELENYRAFLAVLDQQASQEGLDGRHLIRLAHGELAWTWLAS